MGLFFMIFMGIFGGAIAAIVNAVKGDIESAGQPEESMEAVVVSKRMHLTGGEHASTLYYASFELADDRRMELRMNGESYGAIAEGDRGILRKRGTRFVSFTRTDDRFDARGAAQREHKCSACGAPYTGRVCPYCGTPWSAK